MIVVVMEIAAGVIKERTELHDWIVTCFPIGKNKFDPVKFGTVSRCTADYAFGRALNLRKPGEPCSIGIRAIDTDPL